MEGTTEHVLSASFPVVAFPHLRILNRPSRCSRSSSASSLSSPRPRPSLPLPAMVLVSSRRCFPSGEEITSDDPSTVVPLNAPGSGTLGVAACAWSMEWCPLPWEMAKVARVAMVIGEGRNNSQFVVDSRDSHCALVFCVSLPPFVLPVSRPPCFQAHHPRQDDG